MRLSHLALAGVLLLGPTACSSEPASSQRDDDEARSAIIQPGRPGEPNETLPPDATVEQAEANEADVAFMQMMIPHHAQALEMSVLARTRAEDEQVVALARRIHGAQGPEIMSMTAWLQSRDLEVPDTSGGSRHRGHGGHDGAMPGMLSDRQMAELRRARGAEFDRLFLAGMIQHHQGAVEMAREEMDAGSEILALELASEVATGQQAEVERMRDARRSL